MTGKLSITFDDALASVYSLALPEMERLGLIGTVFVISDFIGGRWHGFPVMTEKMLVNLSATGWEIGSHTKSHPNLAKLSFGDINQEFEFSKRRLQRIIKKHVMSVAYPYGEFDSKVESCAARHYLCARTASDYPPLRSNPIRPRNTMRLDAMWTTTPAFTLPLHLIPRSLKRRAFGFLFDQKRSLQENLSETYQTALNAYVVEKWIRKCSRSNRWLILCFHNVSENKPATWYSIALKEFREILRVIAAGPEAIAISDQLPNSKE